MSTETSSDGFRHSQNRKRNKHKGRYYGNILQLEAFLDVGTALMIEVSPQNDTVLSLFTKLKELFFKAWKACASARGLLINIFTMVVDKVINRPKQIDNTLIAATDKIGKLIQ